MMAGELWCYRVEVRAIDRVIASESGDELAAFQAWTKVAEVLERHAKMLIISAAIDDLNSHRQKITFEVIATVSHVP